MIEIHQKTGFSPRKIAKLQLVPVSVRQMYHWIAIFEAENGKGSPRRIMEAKKSKEQAELEDILAFANRAAALTCSRSGAIPAMPTLAELEH